MSRTTFREPPTRTALPDDPEVPQFEVASDPSRMIEVFRSQLETVPGKRCAIEECTPVRFRCRQGGDRYVLQYLLRLSSPETGRRWSQWVTGILYEQPGKAERLWRELSAGHPREGIPERWLTFEPVQFIPALQMLVEVFPFDRRLGNLIPALERAASEVQSFLLARLGPGEWRVESAEVEPTRYRTELGAVLRYTLTVRNGGTGRSETIRCYLKVYRNSRGRDTFHFLRTWAHENPWDEGPYTLARPIAYLGEVRTLALEEASGTTLGEVLRGEGDPTSAARAIGRAVAALNRDTLPVSRHHPLADQLDVISRAASLVQWVRPDTGPEAQAIAAQVMNGLSEVPAAPIHRDLKADHIFLSDGRVTFIDLDTVALGDPVRDPAHLYAYVAAGVGLDGVAPDRLHGAAKAVIGEYLRHVPRAWSERMALHCAGTLIEVAAGIYKRQEPEWPQRMAMAVSEARRALSGGWR